MPQPRAAKRLDMDAMWISATSRATPILRAVADSSAQAAATRTKRGWSSSTPASSPRASLNSAMTTLSPSYSADLPVEAMADMASGWTKDSAPSRISNALTSRSNRSPLAEPGPPHDARPTRCPNRLVSSNTSTSPASPSSRTVSSRARWTFVRYAATSLRPKSWLGRTRRPTNISSGNFRRNIRQSAAPLLARSSGSP